LFNLALGCILLYIFITFSIDAPPMSTRRKLMLSTWSEPSEGPIYGSMSINATGMNEYMKKSNEKGQKITVTAIVVKALALAFRNAPGLNSRLVFDTFIPKPTIDISVLVNVDDGKDLAFLKVETADKKPTVTIAQEMQSRSEKIRKHQDDDINKSKPLLRILPVFILRPLVSFIGYLSAALEMNIPALGVKPSPFGTAIVTSVGMLGIDSGFAPFTPFARVPVLVLIGAIAPKPAVQGDQIVIQDQMALTATIDHRYIDGADIGRLSKELKRMLENPESIDIDVDPPSPIASEQKSQ